MSNSTLRSTQLLQITKMGRTICKTRSKDFDFDQFEECSSNNSALIEKYRFSNNLFHPSVGELLLASLLSLLENSSCQVLLAKKINTLSCDLSLTFSSSSKGTSGKSYYSSNTSLIGTNYSDSSSWILDFDKANYSFSLLNLDVEDSELISVADQMEFHHLQSSDTFPSPTYKMISWPSKRSSNTTITSTTHNEVQEERRKQEFPRPAITLEVTNFEDFDTEEPLYWPFDRKFNWNSIETWRWFTMSPRKNIQKFPTSTSTPDHGPNFEPISFHQRKRPVLKLGSVASNSKIMERRQRNDNKTNSPSGFSIATKNNSEKVVPLETENDITVKSKSGKKSDNLDRNGIFGEEFGSKEELQIEMLLGLDEFDGHEGVDSMFNQDDFSLDESLT